LTPIRTSCSHSDTMVARAIVSAALPTMASAGVSIPTKLIADDTYMPVISIGDGGQEKSEATAITSSWLSLGGRGIDTAYIYGNQEQVGQVIAESGIIREELFITTKIPGCSDVDSYVQKDLQQLGVEYIDLMLIHFPSNGDCGAAWAKLEEYHAQGVLKAIGVSHFERSHIESLKKTLKVVPHVNQIQLNILEHDDDQIAASQEIGINVEAYSPLGRSGQSGDIPGNPTIQKVAAAHNVSTYQVAIKWILQKGHTLTFQSTNPAHQESDADVFGFELTEDEMTELDALHSQGSVVV